MISTATASAAGQRSHDFPSLSCNSAIHASGVQWLLLDDSRSASILLSPSVMKKRASSDIHADVPDIKTGKRRKANSKGKLKEGDTVSEVGTWPEYFQSVRRHVDFETSWF